MTRSMEALSLVAKGHSIDSSAARMGISRTMVNNHLRRARKRLNAKNTVEAVYLAAKMGLIVWAFVCIPLIISFSVASIENGYTTNSNPTITMTYRQARRPSRRKRETPTAYS